MDELKKEFMEYYLKGTESLGDASRLLVKLAAEDCWKWIEDHFADVGKTKICDICGCQISPNEHLCIGSKSTKGDYLKNYGRTIHEKTK